MVSSITQALAVGARVRGYAEGKDAESDMDCSRVIPVPATSAGILSSSPRGSRASRYKIAQMDIHVRQECLHIPLR